MKMLSGWRNSSSVIVVAKNVFNQSKPNDFNYQTLTLKRSAKSRFMPGTHVYPGGACSKSDSSPTWFELYNSFGINKDGIENVMYFPQKITAIRETFEETGILICRSSKQKYDTLVSPWASFIGGAEVKTWQNRVHDDENEFMNLCKQFEVYPDVWSLKEWANWITPPIFNQRFNTLFFLASFLEKPAVQGEESEVQSLEWNTPLELLQSNKHGKLILPPPQFYETSRLLNYKKIDDLAEFAQNKPKLLYPILPYMITTEDSRYSIYPGDDLYPEDYDMENPEMKHFDQLPESYVKHRTMHRDGDVKVMVDNFKPPNFHILPLDFNNSKL